MIEEFSMVDMGFPWFENTDDVSGISFWEEVGVVEKHKAE